MAELVWTIPARQDILSITDYVAMDNPPAAIEIAERIVEATGSLSRFPHQGRPGRKSGTRELVMTQLPYLVVYRAKKEKVEILRVLHGARTWPEEESK